MKNEPMNLNQLAAGDLLTREEAAEMLRIKPQTLAKWASHGRYQLPYTKIGKAVRYRRSDIVAFIEDRMKD